jgi:hypothetical protein
MPPPLFTFVFAVTLVVMVAGVRMMFPRLPGIVVWLLAPLLGTIIAGLQGYPFYGFVAGLIAIALREFWDTIRDHGINS